MITTKVERQVAYPKESTKQLEGDDHINSTNKVQYPYLF